MKITVEITKVEAKKTISNDTEYKLTCITNDPTVLQLAKYINEQTVEIEVRE